MPCIAEFKIANKQKGKGPGTFNVSGPSFPLELDDHVPLEGEHVSLSCEHVPLSGEHVSLDDTYTAFEHEQTAFEHEHTALGNRQAYVATTPETTDSNEN